MSELVFNQPIETGPIRAEFFGDTEKAKGYITAGRKILGAVRTFNGVNQRIAEGEAGGFYRHLAQLEDGTQIEVLTNNGIDTVRIYAVPAPTPVKPALDQEIIIPPEEELPILPKYDEGGVGYSIWLLRWVSGASGSMVLEQWDFANGYTGQSVDLPAVSEINSIQGVLIFSGYVWWVELNGVDGIVHRTSIETKVQETLYTRNNGLRKASTVTPLGVLFAIGNISNLSFVLFKDDGSVVYDVAYSGPGLGAVNYYIQSFINDGTHAYLHQGDGGGYANRLTIIDISTGAHTTVITHQLNPADEQEASWPSVDDYRGICDFAVFDGGVMYEATVESGLYVNSQYKLRVRDPSTNTTSSALVQLTDYDSGNLPPLIQFGRAGGMVEDGLIVMIHADTLIVVDPASKNIISSSATPFVGAAPSTSIIPGSSSVAILYDKIDNPHLALYDPTTGAIEDYVLNQGHLSGYAGYLVQITINTATDPDPTLPPLKEEWEYLSATNVNPI